VEVLAGDLVAGAKGNDPVHFVAQATGGRIIDAVQLTMDTGTIKIPFIEFVTETDNLANDLRLDFLATLTDKDGDSVSDAFSTDLNANEIGGAFDFLLAGLTGEQDSFNVDLASARNDYQVSGFESGSDKLLFIGDAAAGVPSIDNSGDDAVVTVSESGGQTTTVTLVGVDIQSSDIAVLG
jgi:hypothetical protein